MDLRGRLAKIVARDEDGPSTGTILLAAASVMLVTIGFSSTAWWLSGRPASEWPEWVSAGATVAAVGAAIIAGFYAARAFGLEFKREQRWEDQQRSAQASLIAAWPNQFWITNDGEADRIDSADAFVRNASQLPARNVRVLFVIRYDDPNSDFGAIEPLGEATMAYLPPGDEAVHLSYRSWEIPDSKTLPAPTGSQTAEVFIETFFRDSSGQDWFRDMDGQLHPRSEYVMPPH